MTEAIEKLVVEGEARLDEGDYAGAKRLFEEAVAHAERSDDADARLLIVPLMGLARASGENKETQGEALETELALQRRALGIAESVLASDDPLLAEVLHAHGVSVWASGHPAQAIELLQRALDIVRRAHGDAHGYLGPLVGALLDAQRSTDALPHARELLQLEATSSPADLTTLFVVGQCFRDAGANDEARAVFERFLAEPGSAGNPLIRDEVSSWLLRG